MRLSWVLFIFFPFLGAPASSALGQWDFSGSGTDQLVIISESQGQMEWRIFPDNPMEKPYVALFASSGVQAAPGYWLDPRQASLGVVRQDEADNFYLDVLDQKSEKRLSGRLVRGEHASVITGADFDGNGYSDAAVVRRGHKRRATWHLSLNPFDLGSSKRYRIVFGRGPNLPFYFRHRGPRSALAQSVGRGKRARRLIGCTLPCLKNGRVRVTRLPAVFTQTALQRPTVVYKDNGRPSFLFLTTQGSLLQVDSRGRLQSETKIGAGEKALVISGQFGGELHNKVLVLSGGTSQTVSNDGALSSASFLEEALSGRVSSATSMIDYADEDTGDENSGLPVTTLVPSVAPSNTPFALATTTPTLAATPTQQPTFTATKTPSPAATATPVPTATLVPSFTATAVPVVTSTPTSTTTYTPTPTATKTPTSTLTATPTSTPTVTVTATPTATPTPIWPAYGTPQALVPGARVRTFDLGDFNGDGHLDIIVAAFSNSWERNVFYGDSAGNFSGINLFDGHEYTNVMRVTDLNGDGMVDQLMGTNNTHYNVNRYEGGAHNFQGGCWMGINGRVYGLALGDFNNDNRVEFVAAVPALNKVAVCLKNDDSFGFDGAINTSNRGSRRVVAGHFNADSNLDIAVCSDNSTNTLTVHLGQGDGTFATGPATYLQANGCRTLEKGDFNNDGELDLLTSDNSGETWLYTGTGAGSLNNPTQINSIFFAHLIAVDFDNDGYADFAGTDAGTGNILLYRGLGDGTFFLRTTLSPSTTDHEWIEAQDFNGDGLVDIVSADSSNPGIDVFLSQ